MKRMWISWPMSLFVRAIARSVVCVSWECLGFIFFFQSEEGVGSVRTYCQHGKQNRAGYDTRNQLSARRCAAHKRHQSAALAALASPVVRAVLASPLAAAVAARTAVDFVRKLLELGVDKGVLCWCCRERDVRGVSVCLGRCAELLL